MMLLSKEMMGERHPFTHQKEAPRFLLNSHYFVLKFTLDKLSNGLVGVEHDSDGATHGLGWEVWMELASDSSNIAVRTHDFAPLDSEPSVIDGVLYFLNVCNFLSLIEFGLFLILTVLNVDDGLVHSLPNSVSSESSEDSFLVKSDWLSFMVLLGTLLSFLINKLGWCFSHFGFFLYVIKNKYFNTDKFYQ